MEHPELGGTRTGSCAGPLGLPEPRTTVGRAERQVCLYLEAEPRARATRPTGLSPAILTPPPEGTWPRPHGPVSASQGHQAY